MDPKQLTIEDECKKEKRTKELQFLKYESRLISVGKVEIIRADTCNIIVNRNNFR